MTGLAARRLGRLFDTSDTTGLQPQYVIAEVMALTDDPAEVVASPDAGNTTQVMICTSGYTSPVVGDLVLAMKIGARWHIPFSFAASGSNFMTAAQVDAKIASAMPPKIMVEISDAVPGVGWEVATDVWVRDDGAGARTLRIVTGVVSEGSPPPAVSLDPEEVKPNSTGGWRGSYKTTEPKQGDARPWGQGGDWIGAWFYGNKIKEACDAGEVAKIEIELTRKSGGIFGGVEINLGSHNETNRVKPSIQHRYGTGKKLPVNGKARFTLPASIVADLKTGDQKGIACWGEGSGDYAVLSASSGTIIVTYT